MRYFNSANEFPQYEPKKPAFFAPSPASERRNLP